MGWLLAAQIILVIGCSISFYIEKKKAEFDGTVSTGMVINGLAIAINLISIGYQIVFK